MKIFRWLLIAMLAMAACACSGHPVKSSGPNVQVTFPAPAPPVQLAPHSIESEESSDVLVDAREEAEISLDPEADTSSGEAHQEIDTTQQAVDPSTKDIEEDAALIYGSSEIKDPWEKYNRRIHRFNSVADRVFFKPLATTYDKITPDPLQASIGKFFSNLSEPGTAVNEILQGRPLRAAQTLGRFLVNATVGVGGLFDPATRFGIPKYDEDLGQTFAMWGWRDSRYLVLPLFGPRTIRDSMSMAGEQPLSLLGYMDSSRAANGLRILQLADTRSRLLAMDDMRKDAKDDYALVRDMWTQHRNRQIDQDRRKQKN